MWPVAFKRTTPEGINPESRGCKKRLLNYTQISQVPPDLGSPGGDRDLTVRWQVVSTV